MYPHRRPGRRRGRATGPLGLTDLSAALVDVASDVSPSVVAVRSDGGEGSGVIWDSSGTIVTNAHVVAERSTVQVVFADGTQEEGQVVATDPLADVAVIAVERDDLPAVEWSDELPEIGELAMAIGNPLGFEGSVTAGIVSGLGRSIPGGGPTLVDLVQTDAPISPGNSGGALVDVTGQVIGLNVAYVPPAAGASSIGFAIPSPTVADVVGELLEDGRASHAYLGVQPATITRAIAERFGLSSADGVLVQGLERGAPADRAGIERGDILTAVNGEALSGLDDLFSSSLDVGTVKANTPVRSDPSKMGTQIRVPSTRSAVAVCWSTNARPAMLAATASLGGNPCAARLSGTGSRLV